MNATAIYTHTNPNLINGLIAEDRIRTTKMFLYGTVANHPTHAIDISPSADLVQGLPTHVKIKKKKLDKHGKGVPFSMSDNYSIDMACAYRFWLHTGDHRLLIMFYVIEIHYDLNNKRYEVMRFDEVVEIILTEATFKAFRGKVSRQEMARLKGNLLAWRPNVSNQAEADIETEKATAIFHPITEEMRGRKTAGHGLASPSVHLNIKPDKNGEFKAQKRVQSTIPTGETIALVMAEDVGYGPGNYRNPLHPGSQEQKRCIVYDKQFYGLDLPWRTRASAKTPARGWSKLDRTGEITPKVQSPPEIIPQGEDAEYILQWKTSKIIEIPHGELTIFRHKDDFRTIYLDTKITEIRDNLSWACRSVGARLIPEAGCWLATFEKTKRIVEAFTKTPFPKADPETLLEAIPNHANLYTINTGNGPYFVVKRSSGEWAISHGVPESHEAHKAILERRMSSAFYAAGLAGGRSPLLKTGTYKNKLEWIVPGTPLDTIERVAKVLCDYTHFQSVR